MGLLLLMGGNNELPIVGTSQTLGRTDVAAFTTSVGNGTIFVWYLGQAASSGLLSSLHVYDALGTGAVNLGLYTGTSSASDAFIVSTGSIATGVGWRSGTANALITSGEHYWIATKQGGNVQFKHDSPSGYPYDGASGVSYNDPFPAPWGSFTSDGNRRLSAYMTYTTYSTPAIVISDPIASSFVQRSGSTVDLAVSGFAFNFTGDIEGRFNNGPWQTLATIAADGAFSGTLTGQPLGRGSVEVRRVTPNTNLIARVKNVMAGRLYLVTGDSISEGRLTNAQNSNGAQSYVYRQDDQWKQSDDPMDTGTTNGSQWPLLAQLLTAHYGTPAGFVTTGTGSRDIAGGNSGYAKPNTEWGILTAQASEAGSDFEAMLVHLGPNASNGISQADYLTALETWVTDIHTDIQAALPIYLGVFGRSNNTVPNNPPVRRAIAEAIVDGTVECGPNLLGPNWSDGVHPKTDDDAGLVAGRWFAALTGTTAPNITNAYVQTDATKVDLVFDVDLGEANGTTYTTTLFDIAGANPTSATKTSARRVQLVFAASRSAGETFTYVPGEQHIGATMPSSVSVTLPVTVNGVSSVVQPTNPVQLTTANEP
jgi:hypothetical protein